MMRCYGGVQPLGASNSGARVSVVSVLVTPARRVSVQADFFRPLPFPYSIVVLSIFTVGSTEGFNPLPSTVPNFVPTGRLYSFGGPWLNDCEARINTVSDTRTRGCVTERAEPC